MIRYSLRCEHEHDFESWFRDSDAFDEQSRAGFVSCPACGSTSVFKGLMAPSIVTSRRKAMVPTAPTSPAEPAAAPAPVALLDDKALKLRALMRDIHHHVMKTSHDVGAAFPDEARKMHEGLVEPRAIRGEASAADVKALIEDGIEIMPVPQLPDERN